MSLVRVHPVSHAANEGILVGLFGEERQKFGNAIRLTLVSIRAIEQA